MKKQKHHSKHAAPRPAPKADPPASVVLVPEVRPQTDRLVGMVDGDFRQPKRQRMRNIAAGGPELARFEPKPQIAFNEPATKLGTARRLPDPQATHHALAKNDLRSLLAEFERAHGLTPDALTDMLSDLVADRDAEPQAAIPQTVPELWAKRDLNLRETPPAFIRRVYSPWLGKGLTRKHINERDPDLYRALSVWLTRHPEDDIAEALPRQEQLTDRLIARLSKRYPAEALRRIGFAIDARMRKGGDSS